MDDLLERQSNLEDEMGSLGLVMLALVRSLISKGVISQSDIKDSFAELDGLDGEMDGKLDLSFLRSSLGIVGPLRK